MTRHDNDRDRHERNKPATRRDVWKAAYSVRTAIHQDLLTLWELIKGAGPASPELAKAIAGLVKTAEAQHAAIEAAKAAGGPTQ